MDSLVTGHNMGTILAIYVGCSRATAWQDLKLLLPLDTWGTNMFGMMPFSSHIIDVKIIK